MTTVENEADPEAKPSRPSIKLKALVIRSAQKMVSGKPMKTWRTPGGHEIELVNAVARKIKEAGGNGLYQEFEGRAGAAEVIVEAEQKDDERRSQQFEGGYYGRNPT